MAARRFGAFGRALSEFFAGLGPSDFTIRYRPGARLSVRGKIARSKIPAMSEFFARDLNPSGPVAVRGSWNGQSLRLRISGELGESERQRVRNFLFHHLR